MNFELESPMQKMLKKKNKRNVVKFSAFLRVHTVLRETSKTLLSLQPIQWYHRAPKDRRSRRI